MRWINGFFCALMVLFALVQYNDPDAVLWIAIYGVAAAWAGVAAFHPQILADSGPLAAAYGLCLAAALAGSIWLWPAEIASWWDQEEVREGLGVIIATVVLLIVGVSILQARQLRPAG
jgi:hypothetical protein